MTANAWFRITVYAAGWALGIGLATAQPGYSQSNTVNLEITAMTSPEIEAARRAGATTVIIPTGGVEQNGPHMITGKHNLIVAETARRIASRLGNALVAPVIAYTPEGDPGSRQGHMAYAGTISLRPETFEAVLRDAALSFKTHGFREIVFLGDSGPNQAPQRRVADELSAKWASQGTRVIHAAGYYSDNGQVAALKTLGETDDSIGGHAALRDTSELMAVSPQGVRGDRLTGERTGSDGDVSKANAALGQKLLDLKVAAALRDISSARSAPPPRLSLFTQLWMRLFSD